MKVQQVLYKHIPLAKHLGVKIEQFTGNDFCILAHLTQYK